MERAWWWFAGLGFVIVAVLASWASASASHASSSRGGDSRRADHAPFLTPAALRSWYGLTKADTGAGQVIVLPELFRARGITSAVDAFSSRYELPGVCVPGRSQSPRNCFNLQAMAPAGRPRVEERQDQEVEVDVEWAHAIAPRAKIVLVTAHNLFIDAIRAVDRLAHAGQSHIFSVSWCSPCVANRQFALRRDAQWKKACDLAHVVCLMATGDDGAPGNTPSNSPYFLAVGGTFFVRGRGSGFGSQVAWPGSGGGETDVPLPRPAWQEHDDVPCLGKACHRVIPDVSGPAGPAPVYFVAPGGILYIAHGEVGTSDAAPIWAGLIALANQRLAEHGQPAIGIDELHNVLYEGKLATGLEDITGPGARAGLGWDPITGWGSPKAGIVDVLTKAIERYRRQH